VVWIGGGGGIRTHGTVTRARHFQCRTFGHSATPPANRTQAAESSLRVVLHPRGEPKMAEGRGFEPPRDSRPYPISSRTPSTGLGHPSTPILSMTYRVSSLFASNGRRHRVQVKSKFQSARSTYRGNRHDLLDGCDQVAWRQIRVSLNHTQGPPPAEFLDRSQVYPSSHQTGSEGMAERVPGDASRRNASSSWRALPRSARRSETQLRRDRVAHGQQ
jgi:hypothetical protein